MNHHAHKPKNDNLAEEHRKKGNEMFARSKHYEALEFYNKSLCFATTGSKNQALAYGNRSAVYLEVEEFDKCLENIKLARAAGFPKEKLDRLNEREGICTKRMQQEEPNDDDDRWNFFKLSYPPNENYPGIVNCVEMRTNKKYGRHIITNQDLKVGDIIAVEETPFKALCVSAAYVRCANCFKSNKMSLIPMETCASAMFCSQECYDCGKDKEMCAVDESIFSIAVRLMLEALDTLGGDVDKLELLMNDPELRNKTVFDLDLNNPNDPNFKYNQLLSFNSIFEGDDQEFFHQFVHRHPILNRWPSKHEKEIVQAFMLHIIRRIQCTAVCGTLMLSKENPLPLLDGEKIIYGVFKTAFSSLINHSCCPNTSFLSVDNKNVIYVTLPIKKGEQVFMSYFG